MKIKDAYPLSPLQAGLLFQSLYEPDSDAYFLQSILKIEGDLNREALKSAWQRVSDHHAIYRTGFQWEGLDEPLQYVLERVEVPFEIEDWNELTKVEQEKRLTDCIQADRKRGFDLSHPPLFRIKLIICSNEYAYMIWSAHHILSDGWSSPIILGDVFKTYESLVNNQEPRLKPQIPYKNYIAWLQKQDTEKARKYWQSLLSSVEEPTRLSFKGVIEEVPFNQNNGMYEVVFSVEETEAIQQFARKQQVTLSTVLVGALGLLLHYYIQKTEIILGMTVSGRAIDLFGIEEMVGLFINTLPIKVSSQKEDVVKSYLNRLHDQIQKLNEYAYTPLAQIYGWTLQHGGLFDVLLIFENYPMDKMAQQGIEALKVTRIKGIEKTEYPLTIGIKPGKTLELSFNYQLEHFNLSVIERMGEHFKNLLQEFLREKGSLQEFCYLSKQEYCQLIETWNATWHPYPQDKTIIQLFQEQVKVTPKNLALIYEEQSLTYQELNEKTNQLGHYLRNMGVRPDTLVVIMTEKPLEMVIGLLGILKAGGAYVPIDSDYPQERIQFMLDDTNAPFILTDLNTLDKIPATWAQVICLDENWETIKSFPSTDLPSQSLRNHLAYVIYTSGSTGQPKGVLVDNSNLINLIYSMTQIDSFSFASSGEYFLQNVSFSFDPSLWTTFWPLIQGATLIVTDAQKRNDPTFMIECIQKYSLSLFNAGPSLLRAILSQENAKKCQTLMHIMGGGEKWLTEDLKALKATFPNCSLTNVYGPTESTIHVLTWSYRKGRDVTDQLSVPIGRPISNTQIYILDDYMDPVPVGVSGEIYIGGAGLARGYLNRASLTAEKFVPNPFLDEKEKLLSQKLNHSSLRLYSTGDLARYLPDGNIEFMGRKDNQVKIRGFRVELGEIESILSQHRDVEQAFVIAREDKSGHKQLVTYLVPNENCLSFLDREAVLISSAQEEFSVLKGERIASLIEDLRHHLSSCLPDYMIPAFFVFIDKMPLTYNGKIDYKVLPEPDLSLRQIGSIYVSPSTTLEHTLCGIWTEVLHIDKIGIYDNFFSLGGHSLLATQVVSRIRQCYNIDLPLRALFENPTIHTLSLSIENLAIKSARSVIPQIVAQHRPDRIDLSFAQQRLWFLEQLFPETAFYNAPLGLNLKGYLNLIAFEEAFNSLIQRHETLRTIFPVTEGKAKQLVLPHLSIRIEECLVDLSTLSLKDQQTSLEAITLQVVNTPFKLSSGPLVRLKVLKLSSDEHLLLITMHHIISDGWSVGIILKELSALYNAYILKQEPNLLALPIQYVDFTLWQRNWLQGEELEKQLKYWQEELSDIPDQIALPMDRLRPQELSYRGGSYHCVLPKDFQERIKRVANEEQVSLFMVILAAFMVLLHRYTNQKVIVVGTPIAGRRYKEIEGLIGFFVNSLAIKTEFSGRENFKEIIQKVKETVLHAQEHQDVPFEQLVDHLKIPRALNRNPVFQVMMTYQEMEESLPRFEEIEVKPFRVPYPVSKFDLAWELYETQESLELAIGFAQDLFDLTTVERMATHFKILLDALLKTPTQGLVTIPYLSKREYQQITGVWNETNAYAKEKTIIQLFQKQVETNPNNTAVIYGNETLTYKQVNEKANQLAHFLSEQGVGPDQLVAIALERSIEMIIGLLGIMKAGGAYVPLDTSYPEDRLSFVLKDTGEPFLITQEKFKIKFKEYKGKQLVIDEGWEHIQTQSKNNLQPMAYAQSLAYIIYTSGSTGKPKGVMVEHQSLTNRLLWMKKQYEFTSIDKILQKTPFAFDVSVWELFCPLISGSTEVFAKPEGHKDPLYLLDILRDQFISVIHFVPSMLNSFLEEANLESCYNLRLIITSGEALEKYLEIKCQHWFKGRLDNLYGPTEATIDVTYYSCKNDQQNTMVPIGRPIDNTQIYILDEDLQPVPIGVVGEIYIAGIGLARGYWGRPSLTAERFIPNPFGNNTRLYKTGDLARYLVDGNIEFLGRSDDQVKVRGYRIELGEIESAIAAYKDISQVVVVAREDEPGIKKIVAYLVPGGNKPSLTELRVYLEAVLPEYMVPSIFIYLEQIPLTVNGKVDRKALPVPDFSSSSLDEYVAPRSEREQILSEIWASVLGIERVGIKDHFFRIGGDSIISIQLVSKARQKGISFSVKDVFNHPTVEGLAMVSQDKKGSENLQAEQNIVSGEVLLTPIQNWFFEQKLAKPQHFNLAILLQPCQKLEMFSLARALNNLVLHHDGLRLRFMQKDNNWCQEYMILQNQSMLKEVNLSAYHGSNLKEKITGICNETQNSFDLSKGPLIKLVLMNCGNDHQRLLIVLHHLVADGVSWRILLEDLENLYEQEVKGQSISLPLKTLSYQQWSKILQTYAKSKVLQEEKIYWRAIEGKIKLLPEKDKVKERKGEEQIQILEFTLNKEDTRRLLYEVPSAYRTEINDSLLTALVLTIEEWTGEKGVSFSLEGHGREEIIHGVDISRTIGWFTSVFPVYLEVSKNHDIGRSLKTVKETLRGIPNRGIGYGILRYLTDERKNIQDPSISFNYLGQWDQQQNQLWKRAEESPGLSVAPQNKNLYSLNINAEVREGQLQVYWIFDQCYATETIEKIGNSFISQLKKIINHCCQEGVYGYTSSDFDLVGVDQVLLIDDLINEES